MDEPTREDGDVERTKIRKELSSMTFEDLQKLKEKLGTKVYNEAMFGTTKNQRKVFKRENKNRPREMSSKRPVTAVREVIPVKTEIPRDPRFDSLSGEFNEKAFKSSYKFVSEFRAKELEQLKEELKATSDPEQKSKLKYLVQRLENQLREEQRQKQKEINQVEERKANKEAIKTGQKPFFRKKSDKRVMELVDQYEELKKTGKLKRKIEKYRKKNIAKNRGKLSSVQ